MLFSSRRIGASLMPSMASTSGDSRLAPRTAARRDSRNTSSIIRPAPSYLVGWNELQLLRRNSPVGWAEFDEAHRHPSKPSPGFGGPRGTRPTLRESSPARRQSDGRPLSRGGRRGGMASVVGVLAGVEQR